MHNSLGGQLLISIKPFLTPAWFFHSDVEHRRGNRDENLNFFRYLAAIMVLLMCFVWVRLEQFRPRDTKISILEAVGYARASGIIVWKFKASKGMKGIKARLKLTKGWLFNLKIPRSAGCK